MRRIFD